MVSRSFVDIAVDLSDGWPVEVHERGYALLDGWFVEHVVDRDEQERPSRVVVVDVERDWRIGDADESGEVEEYRFVLRFADVAWPGGEPSVVVQSDSGSQRDGGVASSSAHHSWGRSGGTEAVTRAGVVWPYAIHCGGRGPAVRRSSVRCGHHDLHVLNFVGEVPVVAPQPLACCQRDGEPCQLVLYLGGAVHRCSSFVCGTSCRSGALLRRQAQGKR